MSVGCRVHILIFADLLKGTAKIEIPKHEPHEPFLIYKKVN